MRYQRKRPEKPIINMPLEVWADVPGWEGVYSISSMGRIQSLKYGNRLMNPSKKPNGYIKISLYENGQGKTVHIHQLVAKAFLPNPECKIEINHKNGDKMDNRADNLEWSDRSANGLHSYRVLGRISTFAGKKREQVWNCKLTSKDVWEIFELRTQNVPFKEIASKFKVSFSTIENIVYGNRVKK